MLLGLQAWAEFCYTGGMDRGHICRRLAACTGADGRALARISAFNKTPLLDAESDLPNAAKFLLYQDPLLGLYDLDIEGLALRSTTPRWRRSLPHMRRRAASGRCCTVFMSCWPAC